MINDKAYFSDFPYISTELFQWLGNKRIKILGLDLPCPNISDWKTVHRNLLGNSVLIVEGLINLEFLPQEEFLFMALPLKIKGSDGSPVRALAVIDEK